MGFKILQALIRGFLHLIFRYRVEGKENIPENRGAIIAMNHRSYWDVVFAGAVMPKKLRYMAKSELFKNWLFGGLIKALGAFPIERGRGDIGAIKTSLEILDNGNLMLIFPEGRRVRNREHIKAKSGVSLIALKAQAPIIPVYISGEYKLWNKITVKIGEPIEFSDYYDKKVDTALLQKLADGVLSSVYALEVKND